MVFQPPGDDMAALQAAVLAGAFGQLPLLSG
jgi:hypothetical protein